MLSWTFCFLGSISANSAFCDPESFLSLRILDQELGNRSALDRSRCLRMQTARRLLPCDSAASSPPQLVASLPADSTPVRSGSVQAAELPARTNTSDDSSCTKWCIICYRPVGSHIRCSIRTPPAGSKSIASPHQTCTLRHACPQTVWKVMDDPLACGAHIQRACPAHRRPRRGAPCAVPPGL